jgi:tetratricopeptide (TPR) repeat protein
MLRRKTLAAATAVLFFGLSRQAEAQSVWTRAASPRTANDVLALRRSERALRRFGMRLPPKGAARWSLKRRSLLQAQAMLELVGASQSPSVRMRYQMATIYRQLASMDNDSSLFEQALPLLDFVIQNARATQLRADALFDKAVTLARLGRTVQEFVPYRHAIQIDPRNLRSIVLLANLAETHMLVGQLKSAIASYQASLRLIPTVAYRLLAPATLWGLAVALDRFGDLPAALKRVAEARLFDPKDKALKDGSWFFAPDYDRHWFQALGHWSEARSSSEAPAKQSHLDAAAAQLKAFLAAAPTSERYRALAQARLVQVKRERARTKLAKANRAAAQTKR